MNPLMNPVFQKNLEAFKSELPSVAGLTEHQSIALKLFPSKTGVTTGRCNEILLHSAYDPIKEAEAFASHIEPGSKIGLYGFGLGYHIEALLERIGPDGEIIVFELNPELLAGALAARDLSHLAEDTRLTLVFADQEQHAAEQISQAMGALNQEDGEAPIVLFHPSSYECLPSEFPNISRALEVIRLERKVPALFGNLEKQNAELNWDIVVLSQGMRQLQGSFPDKPALLISAGPSLDGLLPFLPSLAGFCVVTCVDTAMPALASVGIQPQFVFSVDPQDESFSHFENHLSSTASLVYQPTAHPRVVHHYKGDKIVVFKEGHRTTHEHERLALEKGTSPAGGSVSCLALDCLIQLGCNPILLAGQDCAFPGGRVYGRKGSAQIDEAAIISRETSGGELQNTRSRRYEKFQVTGCQGQNLFTSPALFSYLRTIEQIAEAHPDVKIVNLSSQGALIENTTTIGSFNELMTLLPDCGILE